MFALTQQSIAHPWRTVVLWLVLVAISLPFALQLAGQLKAGGFSNPRGEGAQAQRTLEQTFGDAPNSLQVAVHSPAPANAAAVTTVLDVVQTFPDVTAVQSPQTDATLLSQDGRTALVHVNFGVDNTTTQNHVPALRRALTDAVLSARLGDLQVNVTGAPALDYDLNVQSKADATRAELIAFPLLCIVLLLVFRSVGAMLAPLALAGVALVVTQALGFALAQLTDLSILFTNGGSLIGLAVAVDYSLFIVKRYREQLAAGHNYAPALDIAMKTAGRSVMFSALAVVVALSALFIPRIMVFTSIALAGVLVTVVALAISMTLLPAALTLMGGKIHWLSLHRKAPQQPEKIKSDGNARQSTRTRLRAGGALLGLIALMLLLAAPMLAIRLEVPVASASILPDRADSRIGIERLRADIGSQGLFPIHVVLTGTNPAQVQVGAQRAAELIADLPKVSQVQTQSSGGSPAVVRILVFTGAEPDSPAAHNLVRTLRTQLQNLAGTGLQVQVTGATAQGIDFDDLVVGSVPVILGGVAVATFVLLVWAFRSWRLPLMALVLNALVVCASLGVLTAVFQGWLDEPINSVTPLLLFAVMFGLSMDYLVIMISRMQELFRAGIPHDTAVRTGLKRTRGLVNGAALIMVAVFASFGTAEISIVRQLGLGLAVAVLLDAVVVRLLLMPAALQLLGPRVWGRSLPDDASSPTVHAEPMVPAGHGL